MSYENVIGVTMDPANSILNRNCSYEEMAKIVADHMITSRPAVEVYWLPYIQQKGICFREHILYVDAKEIYPESKPGDVVYVSGNIWVEKDYEIWINLIGVVEVYLDGECLFSSWEKTHSDQFISLPVNMEADRLYNLVIKTVCTEDEHFGFRLNVSPTRCPGFWASHYLVMARVLLPIAGLTKEEGLAVSPLYTGASSPKEGYESHYEFERTPAYQYPEIKKEERKIDFKKLYTKGNIAFAYTIAKEEGYVVLKADSASKAIIKGKSEWRLERGREQRIDLQKGDELLIKSLHEKSAWGFELMDSVGIGLPMLQTDRQNDFKLVYCGPFYQRGLEVKLPPEYAENVLQTYPDGKGKRVFWRFMNAFLRAYHNSNFFGQWYYASILSCKGIRCVGESFDVPKYVDYFLKNEELLADWSEYAIYDYKKFDAVNFMHTIAWDSLLDNIGTMGENFIDAYRLTGDRKYLPMIRKLQWNIRHTVPRFEDGTFKRMGGKTMWADDFHMCGPFLTKLYSQMGDEDSLKDILCQLEGFVKRLYLPEEKIFSHIYFWEEGVKNSIPWGRGNGWIALSMSEMLLHIPTSNPAHETIRKVFAEFCEGIAAVQDECGLWHQVLNRPESYLETSCTAMFTLAFYRGVRNGWISKKYLEYADRGLHAILERCVDEEGVVYGVCMGSSCSMDPEYYFNLYTIKDDNHGTGVVMMMLCEKALLQ